MKGFRVWGLGFSFIAFVFLYPIPYLRGAEASSAYTLYPVHALENDIGYSKIDPSSPIYFLKTVRENLELKLALTSRVKMLRQLEFATRRLREARTLIGKSEDLIPPTLERYYSNLRILQDEKLKKDGEVTTRIRESLVVHLQTLINMYSKLSSPRAKMYVRSTLNRIIQKSDIPSIDKIPVCSLFAKEASGSALNQTEKFVLSDRAEKCFHSLPVK